MNKIIFNISKVWNNFLKSYKTKFHSKWYSTIIYFSLIVSSLFLVLFLNIYFLQNGKYSLKTTFFVLTHWAKDQQGNEAVQKAAGLSLDQWQSIQNSWYNIFATCIAGIGMTLAAVATQSLTRNPMAEGSTLGLVQAGIFGVLFSLSFGFTSLLEKFTFTIIFSALAAGLLLVFIVFSKRSGSSIQKIILAGLAIGVIFKTLSFIIKRGDVNLKTVSFSYVLGGAESISSQSLALGHDLIVPTLLISTILILIAILISIINIKGMNLLEIGDERAKNLGSSIMLTRILNVLIVLLALPAAVILVGNMAFLGLFSVHAARWIMKSRNYKKVLPASIVIGILIASLGLQLTQHFTQINSGIWMTFIGAPYLMYIGIRGLK